MKIAFFIYDYQEKNLRLQPWLTIHRLVDHFIESGHDVQVVTDAQDSMAVTGVPVIRVASLRGSNSDEVRSLIRQLEPDCAITLVTPLNLVTTGWYDAFSMIPAYAYASYAFYRPGELFTALRHVKFSVLSSYLRHLLVPRILWKSKLRTHFRGVVSQSESTQRHLSHSLSGAVPVYFIPPGIDKDIWRKVAGKDHGNEISNFLYVGRASRIRGFHIALDAMAALKEEDVRLRVLARGADDAELSSLDSEIRSRGLSNHVEIEGGWLDIESLVAEIQSATAVLLPFVLVPSELPVSVMEVIASGTPVITSNVDGLPSATGQAGVVVQQGCSRALAEAMLKIHRSKEYRAQLRRACRTQASSMTTWAEMGKSWEGLLLGGGDA